MRDLGSARTVSAVSLSVTAVIVIVMALWGYRAATAPLDDTGTSSDPISSGPVTCGPGEEPTNITFLRSSQVVVSVYNAGQKKGRATETLNLLEARKFRPGAIGNATDAEVSFVEIHAKAADTVKAQLVALNFGPKAEVITEDDQDLRGPGVNVIIGDDFKKLKAKTGRKIELPEPVTTCT